MVQAKRKVPYMKKKYVKPKFTFISNLNHLESIKQWNHPELIEKSQHVVEVTYIACKQPIQQSLLQRKKQYM